jgi:hypothetical protein
MVEASMDQAFYLMRHKDKDYCHAVRVFEGPTHEGPHEDFVLTEPVYVEANNRLWKEDRVFWITRIVSEEAGCDGPQVWLTFSRYGGHGDVSVCPTDLRKLPAMLRIAHEASD